MCDNEIIKEICKLDFHVLLHLYLCADQKLTQQDLALALETSPMTLSRDIKNNVISSKRASAVLELLKSEDWKVRFEKIAAIQTVAEIAKRDCDNWQKSLMEVLVQKTINDIAAIGSVIFHSDTSYPKEWVDSICSTLYQSVDTMKGVAMARVNAENVFRLE